jgi:transposase InsO family protein
VYVAFIIDAFSRRIVGWRVSRTAHTGFVLDRWSRLCMKGGPCIAATYGLLRFGILNGVCL